MAVLVSKVTGWKADTRTPKYEVCVQLNNMSLTVGIPLSHKPLSQRSYVRHSGLRNTVAWIMNSLLDIRPGNLVLDPMCGAGTLLIEGAQMCKVGKCIAQGTVLLKHLSKT